GRNPAAVADLVTVFAGPLPNFTKIGFRGRRPRPTRTPTSAPTATDPTRVPYPRRHRLAQCLSICRGKINFVRHAVEGERHGLLGLAAVKVVDENNLHLLRHEFS